MVKSFLRFLWQTIIITLITFSLGEVSLRVYNHFKPSYIFYDDSYSRYRGKPHDDFFGFKLNSKGFLDVEFDPKKKSGSFRILGIGDSFAQGVVPYEYNWLTLLKSKLNRSKPEKSVEVLNMGIPCIGPPEYLSLLVREGLPLNPDMVMVAFFTGNDFAESIPEKRPLYSYSYVVSLLNYAIKVNTKIDTKIVYNGKMVFCDDCPNFDLSTFTNIERMRSFIYVEGDKRFLRLCDKSVDLLRQMSGICRKKGIKFVVVIIPDEIQINERLQREIKSKFYSSVDESRWKIDLPNRLLSERLTSLGIDNLDLYPYFAKESERKNLYKPRDTHWNKAGNQLAADVIQEYISKKASMEIPSLGQ